MLTINEHCTINVVDQIKKRIIPPLQPFVGTPSILAPLVCKGEKRIKGSGGISSPNSKISF